MRQLLLVVCVSSCAANVDVSVGDPGEDAVPGSGLTEADTQGAEADRTAIEARVCASGATTLGIDVSYYQDTINWTSVRNAGVRFAFVRLSDGEVFHDPKFSANWTGARQA